MSKLRGTVRYKKKIWAKVNLLGTVTEESSRIQSWIGAGSGVGSEPDPLVLGADPDPNQNVTDPQHRVVLPNKC